MSLLEGVGAKRGSGTGGALGTGAVGAVWTGMSAGVRLRAAEAVGAVGTVGRVGAGVGVRGVVTARGTGVRRRGTRGVGAAGREGQRLWGGLLLQLRQTQVERQARWCKWQGQELVVQLWELQMRQQGRLASTAAVVVLALVGWGGKGLVVAGEPAAWA